MNEKILEKLRTQTQTVPALLSVCQVASLFPTDYDGNIRDTTVRKWITDGLLEGIKQGRYIWIKAEEVNRFIEEGRQPKKGGDKIQRGSNETKTD